jgi:hypothetical protein
LRTVHIVEYTVQSRLTSECTSTVYLAEYTRLLTYYKSILVKVQ